MHRTLLALALACCACSAGPSRPGPEDYRPTAVAIRAHLNGIPAETSDVTLTVSWIDRLDSPMRALYAGSDIEPFREDGIRFEITAGNSYQRFQGSPDVRFFIVSATPQGPDASPSPGASPSLQPYWGQPGLYLVYALIPTTWTPWRPTGQTVAIPQGYSWLRASCGSVPGRLQLEVRPIDEVVELTPQEGPAPDTWSSDLQVMERELVQNCGATIPGIDIGTRVSFDVASSLAWAPDGSQLYYLSVPAEQDRTESVGLRQVRPSDTVTSELMVIPNGQGLQVDQNGTLFVGNRDGVLHISTSTGVPTITATIPAPADFPATDRNYSQTSPVSPDGRWIAYLDYGWSLRIWDVQRNTPLDSLSVGTFAGWSPSGELAYWGYQPDILGVTTLSGVPGGPKVFSVAHSWHSSLAWTATGPIVANTPISWSEWAGTSYDQCFGLSLLDPATGVERAILDESAGFITFVPDPLPLDTVFVWARNCQGLLDTVCTYALLRVTATTGAVQTVAVAPARVPVAISPDGRHLALGTSKGIYVKDLPQ